MPKNKYPEHRKLEAIKDKSQAIGAFIDYGASEQGLRLCEMHTHSEGCGEIEDDLPTLGEIRECGFHEGQYMPTGKRINAILAEQFGINEDKLEKEKVAMIEECRSA